MNPDCEVFHSLDIPRHGRLPKWLIDITDSVTKLRESKSCSSLKMYNFGAASDILEPNAVPQDIPNEINTEKQTCSAKYGRRSSSIITQYNATVTPKHVHVSKEEYLIPNVKTGLDESGSSMDFQQDALEKSWKGLNLFQKLHMGRLDSAQNYEHLKNLSYVDNNLSPISSMVTTSSSEGASYSPSILENSIPSRSRSEMSNFVPYFLYSNIKQATETDWHNSQNVPKSKSNDHVPKSGHTGSNFHLDYQQKVAQEEELRKKIINELLTENEKIIQQMEDGRRCEKLKSPSLDDLKLTSAKKKKNKKSKKIRQQTNIEPPEEFIIPTLPKGKLLIINILNTWGDRHYVGLNGIDLFGDDGKIITVHKISANPSDVNVLPEISNDPRRVTNLLDGVNRTQDDVHVWLTPFTSGQNHVISVEFSEASTVAMIRIWNYNKSRIHSYRGAREVEISLDGCLIFIGEIRKACGGIMGGVDSFGDTILFTTDEEILDKIAENDNFYPTLISNDIDENNRKDRPQTSTCEEGSPRPITGLNRPAVSDCEEILFGAHRIDLILVGNWSDPNFVGFTGFEFVQGSDALIALEKEMLTCSAICDDLGALINGRNLTTDRQDMWRANFENGEVMVTVSFDSFVYVSGIRVWNYNESLDKSSMGVSKLKIFVDGKQVENNNDGIFWIRRAPGNVYYDFVQDLKFDNKLDADINATEPPSLGEKPKQFEFFEYPDMPVGFVVQFSIFSTWGDQYYCGLNGLEVYDEFGGKIHLDESNICAYPESVNVLKDVIGDVRTPDKLIDGINDDNSGGHSWLAPVLPKCLNKIYIVMDRPIKISMIKMWNYSKTTKRGVKEFAVLVDDLLVYNGVLDEYSPGNSCNYRAILFADNEEIIEREKIVKHSGSGGQVLLVNQDLRTTSGGSLPEADPALRPFTSVGPYNRGYTSQSQ